MNFTTSQTEARKKTHFDSITTNESTFILQSFQQMILVLHIKSLFQDSNSEKSELKDAAEVCEENLEDEELRNKNFQEQAADCTKNLKNQNQKSKTVKKNLKAKL